MRRSYLATDPDGWMLRTRPTSVSVCGRIVDGLMRDVRQALPDGPDDGLGVGMGVGVHRRQHCDPLLRHAQGTAPQGRGIVLGVHAFFL